MARRGRPPGTRSPLRPRPILLPSATPLTEYMTDHPNTSQLAIAAACGVNVQTVRAALIGLRAPTFATLLKFQRALGIPVMAWVATKAVQVELERKADPHVPWKKLYAYRAKRRAEDPTYLRSPKEKEMMARALATGRRNSAIAKQMAAEAEAKMGANDNAEAVAHG